jgi:hypothetical protein
MDYARDRRTKQIVQADKIRWTDRNRAYECPVCKAAVHYKKAMGLSPYPGFAHNAHAGRLDCDLYHPSLVGELSTGWTGALEEDETSEFDLCLDDQENWSLFLRFPEISDLGNARLRTLATGSVSVVTGNDSKNISLMELRPGVGSARLVVPPSINSYDATPAGKWPPDLPSDRWNGSCPGLNPRGTPFVLRNGEWERLRPGAELKLGSEIRILAEATNAPPAMYSSVSAVVVSHNKLTWRVWRVSLPDAVSNSLDRWAEAVEVNFVRPADELSLIGIPQGFGSDGAIFSTGHRFIAKVKCAPDEAPSTLSLRTPLGSESSSTWPTQESPTYLAFSIRDRGMTTLTANYDPRGSVGIETAAGPTPGEVRKKLNAVQPLQIRIGDISVMAWQQSASLRPAPGQADFPTVAISPDYDALRFDMQWTNEDGVKCDYDLTAQMVQDRVAASWGRDADFHISAGAFGSVHLLFQRPNRSQSSTSVSRVMRWAVLANGRLEPGASSWLRRNLAALKKPLRGRARGTSVRWLPLLVNEVKRSEKRT